MHLFGQEAILVVFMTLSVINGSRQNVLSHCPIVTTDGAKTFIRVAFVM